MNIVLREIEGAKIPFDKIVESEIKIAEEYGSVILDKYFVERCKCCMGTGYAPLIEKL